MSHRQHFCSKENSNISKISSYIIASCKQVSNNKKGVQMESIYEITF